MSEDVPSLKDFSKPHPLKPQGVIFGEKHVRSRSLQVGFVVSLFILFIGGLLLIHPPYSSHAILLQGTLKPQYYYHPSFNMSEGEKLIIQGYVKGGNNDIWIYIKEGPKTVKNFGRIRSPVDLIFVAPEDGVYTVYVDNSISVVTSKYVDLKIIHKYRDYSWGFLVLFWGSAFVLAFGLALVKGMKVIVVKIGDEVYEFRISKKGDGKLGVKVIVNGYELPQKLRPGDKFKIGPSDEHLLEIDLWHGNRGYSKGISIKVDGYVVGRLP